LLKSRLFPGAERPFSRFGYSNEHLCGIHFEPGGVGPGLGAQDPKLHSAADRIVKTALRLHPILPVRTGCLQDKPPR
jgi:hypothetical protein